MNAPNTSESTAIAVAARQQYDLSPRDFDEAWRMADYLANSDMVPKDFKGKPGNCLVAVQWGAELGLKTMQAIQNIAVINGRPSLWGDVMLALVRASPLCEYVVESVEGERAVCRVKRRGEPEQLREFTKEDAVKANLWTKDGPWKQYPKRMLQMRARAWALRDVFTDVLKGLHMAEEAMDMAPEKHMGPAEVVQPTGASSPAVGPAAAPEWSDAELAKREPKIREFYGKGKSADDIIGFYGQKGTLSDAQKKRIRELQPIAAAAASPAPAPAVNQAQDVTPKVTYATVADAIAKAKEHAELDAAKALIPQVADEQHRAELTRLAELRGDELAF